jgi:hypothetical protein
VDGHRRRVAYKQWPMFEEGGRSSEVADAMSFLQECRAVRRHVPFVDSDTLSFPREIEPLLRI